MGCSESAPAEGRPRKGKNAKGGAKRSKSKRKKGQKRGSCDDARVGSDAGSEGENNDAFDTIVNSANNDETTRPRRAKDGRRGNGAGGSVSAPSNESGSHATPNGETEGTAHKNGSDGMRSVVKSSVVGGHPIDGSGSPEMIARNPLEGIATNSSSMIQPSLNSQEEYSPPTVASRQELSHVSPTPSHTPSVPVAARSFIVSRTNGPGGRSGRASLHVLATSANSAATANSATGTSAPGSKPSTADLLDVSGDLCDRRFSTFSDEARRDSTASSLRGGLRVSSGTDSAAWADDSNADVSVATPSTRSVDGNQSAEASATDEAPSGSPAIAAAPALPPKTTLLGATARVVAVGAVPASSSSSAVAGSTSDRRAGAVKSRRAQEAKRDKRIHKWLQYTCFGATAEPIPDMPVSADSFVSKDEIAMHDDINDHLRKASVSRVQSNMMLARG